MSNANTAQFRRDATRLTADLRHRAIIQTALKKYEVARDAKRSLFQDYQGARQRAADVKFEAVNHLDRYLTEFADKFEARGGKVHWASTAEQAREIILGIVRGHGAKSVVKSKVMTGEEIHLNEALERAGLDVVESDLGEYIVQLRKEPPYHFVFPAMHLSRGEISDLFEKELGSAPTTDPEELTMIARRVLRDKYVTADVGISGANFAVAETGMISITENEGNARLTCAVPRVHVALMGIEKVLPKLADLALFLPLLGTAGAGQALTGYNSMYGGPRQPGEADGPAEMHVVLLDNGRTTLLADAEQRDALHCIRCGACLNVCPIYKNVGGHTYGTTYQGPIGSVITPHLRGIQAWKHLSYASSLCGACTEACPVKIDLHHHLLQGRRNASAAKPNWAEKVGFKAYAAVVNRPRLFTAVTRLARFAMPLHRPVAGGRLDPLRAWTATRALPPVAARTFREQWRAHNRAGPSRPGAAACSPPRLAHGTSDAGPPPEAGLRVAPPGPTRPVSIEGREAILGRIREALRVPAKPPHTHTAEASTTAAGPADWLPFVGPTVDDRIALFAKNSADLKTTFRLVDGDDAWTDHLRQAAIAGDWRRVAAHRTELTERAVGVLGLPVLWTDDGYDARDLERCDAGLTGCDALVAQTGSVLLTSRSAGGRALSILPPHHVVLARREQMVADLPAAFELLAERYAGGYPSFMSLVTGPSRTGDIERILVLGAHGPKELTVLCL